MLARLISRNVVSSTLRMSYDHGVSELPMVGEHISERLHNTTLRYPNNEYIVSLDQNIRWTYQEFNQRVTEIARGMVALGLQPGDRIGIYAPNMAE